MAKAVQKKNDKMAQQTAIYNRSARDLPVIPVGQTVRVYNFRTKIWDLKAKVMKIDWNTGRSYRLRTNNGTWIFRNRRFIKVCKTKDDQKQAPNHLEGHVSSPE